MLAFVRDCDDQVDRSSLNASSSSSPVTNGGHVACNNIIYLVQSNSYSSDAGPNALTPTNSTHGTHGKILDSTNANIELEKMKTYGFVDALVDLLFLLTGLTTASQSVPFLSPQDLKSCTDVMYDQLKIVLNLFQSDNDSQSINTTGSYHTARSSVVSFTIQTFDSETDNFTPWDSVTSFESYASAQSSFSVAIQTLDHQIGNPTFMDSVASFDTYHTAHSFVIPLTGTGEPEEAMHAARQAANRCEELAAADPTRYFADLATSLQTLSTSLSDVGKVEEALAFTQQAATICQLLTGHSPVEFPIDPAHSLKSHLSHLGDTGRIEKSLAVIRDVLTYCETLGLPADILKDLADALHPDHVACWGKQNGSRTDVKGFVGQGYDGGCMSNSPRTVSSALSAVPVSTQFNAESSQLASPSTPPNPVLKNISGILDNLRHFARQRDLEGDAALEALVDDLSSALSEFHGTTNGNSEIEGMDGSDTIKKPEEIPNQAISSSPAREAQSTFSPQRLNIIDENGESVFPPTSPHQNIQNVNVLLPKTRPPGSRVIPRRSNPSTARPGGHERNEIESNLRDRKNREPDIRLRKGKWPEDFMDSPPQLRRQDQIAGPLLSRAHRNSGLDSPHGSKSVPPRSSSTKRNFVRPSRDDVLMEYGVDGRNPNTNGDRLMPFCVIEEGKNPTHFQLGRCIGRGKFGSVYRALNLNTGEMVAVKRIPLNVLNEKEITRLMGDVDLVKNLSHPNIVEHKGMFRDVDFLSIVLEYVDNSQTLKAFGKLNERLLASYVTKILEGLLFLHANDVVHYNLKASNIFTTKNGNVKFDPMNLATGGEIQYVSTQDVTNWMAPEIIELKGASPKSDIWSLACTIIELLTGRPPYSDIDNLLSVMFRIVEDDMPPIPKDCSPLLHDFLVQCFHRDPSKRPSAQELYEHEWLKKSWIEYKGANTLNESSVKFPPKSQQRPSNPVLRDRDPITPGEHTFVKTTFSKPMVCRICLLQVRKNAALCAKCSLISHTKCTSNASPTCALRAQLLLYALHANDGTPANGYSSVPRFLSDAGASIATIPRSEAPDYFGHRRQPAIVNLLGP